MRHSLLMLVAILKTKCCRDLKRSKEIQTNSKQLHWTLLQTCHKWAITYVVIPVLGRIIDKLSYWYTIQYLDIHCSAIIIYQNHGTGLFKLYIWNPSTSFDMDILSNYIKYILLLEQTWRGFQKHKLSSTRQTGGDKGTLKSKHYVAGTNAGVIDEAFSGKLICCQG